MDAGALCSLAIAAIHIWASGCAFLCEDWTANLDSSGDWRRGDSCCAAHLLPLTEIAGSYALLTIFSLAAVIHILHGDYDVSVLILYGVGVFATLANRNERSGPPITR